MTVAYPERMAKLAELVTQLDGNAMADASEQLLQRLAYVDFFGLVLNTVPTVLPHEGGALWWDAISRPFMPRLFFPEKTAIDDTVRTSLLHRRPDERNMRARARPSALATWRKAISTLVLWDDGSNFRVWFTARRHLSLDA